MKTINMLSVADLVFLLAACGNGKAEQQARDTVPGNTGAAPAAAPPPSASSGLKAIMDSTVVRMGGINLSNNPTKDFAVLMRVHHAGVRNLIQEGLKNNSDSGMAKLARSIDADLRKEWCS